ncbi:hypothetical protein [Aureimonas leprariae]|uniref:Uncharacterized protein n=1 Tax=Plantimonas leprariae TaxID=2615207 RepID=A0A7V7PSM3_9HYPH|nr:hypothetical protein [Aureimonas leprariae]KAB0682073.1 hypothetical protein F6X38_04545 [Aureimonas leprariae]
MPDNGQPPQSRRGYLVGSAVLVLVLALALFAVFMARNAEAPAASANASQAGSNFPKLPSPEAGSPPASGKR